MVPEIVPVKSICTLVSPAHRTTLEVGLTSGFGSTDTTISNGEPEHPLAKGVTVYVAVWTLLVGLVNVPEIVAEFVPAIPPIIPPVTTGAIHE